VAIKNYFQPQSLDEAVGLLAEHGPALLVMAGGTIAMPLINEGISLPELVMGLRQAGLGGINRANGTISIGAVTTLSQLLALDAAVKLVGPSQERVVPLADFYTGFMTHDLQPDELLAEIQVPIPAGQAVYLKYGRRQANTPSIVTVAVHLVQEDGQVTEARIALNGVGPHPLRAQKAEAALVGQALEAGTIAAAAAAASEECEPFTDAIASEWYRRKMTGVYVSRALSQLAGEEK
jgi:CO/xanthine dehydrogenase FAD-binding subunit